MIHKEACGGEKTANIRFKKSREKEMDQGSCGARDCSGKKGSARRRDSDDARAGTYGKYWKGTNDKDIT